MRERERERTSTGLARCSMTVQSEAKDKLSKWFEGGRSIFLRGKSDFGRIDWDENWFIFTVPTNCLYPSFTPQQTQNNVKNDNNPMFERKFNHSLSHVFPANFALPHISVSEEYAEQYDASWVVLGSTIYFFGATGITGSPNGIYYLERNADGTTFPFSLDFESAGCMISERRAPKVVALDGKIYVFGDNKDVFGEVFEPYPDSLEGRSVPLSSPIPSNSPCDILFCVPIEKERKIVVAWNYKIPDVEATSETAVFVYDVVDDSWVKHNTDLCFDLRTPLCKPIAVDGCLYWLDTKMRAYDLDTRQYFEGRIEDCLFQKILETPGIDNLRVSLLHLVGDLFCVVWVDCHDSRVIHCTTIQARRTTINIHGNRFKLRATVFSCQSFASKLSPHLQDRALIL